MKIAVIGSRNFTDYKRLTEELHRIIYEENENDFKNVVIISGGAKGADSLGAKYAKDNHMKLIVHEADWKNLSHPDARIKSNQYGDYDANAGHRRNTLIINDADIVVAFHNHSPGTANSLGKACKANKKIFEFLF